jgi:intraflagellar transport protein 46
LDQDVAALLTHINDYQPRDLTLPTHLKPFIPDYCPALGAIDAFVKVGVP